MKRFTTLLLLTALLLSALPALADAPTHNAGLPGGAAEAVRLLLRLGTTTIQTGTTPIARPAQAAPADEGEDKPALGSKENPYTEGDFLGKTFEEVRDLGALEGKFFAGADGVAEEIKQTSIVTGSPTVQSAFLIEGTLFLDFLPPT